MQSLSTGSTRPSLVIWLFLGVLSATVAAVITCSLVIDGFMRNEADQQAKQYLQANADALRDALDRGMARHYEEVLVISQLDPVAGNTDPHAIRRALEHVRSSFPQFAWIGLADRSGKVVAAADGLLQGVDVSSRPWFSGAKHGPYVGDVHPAVLLAKLLPAQDEPWRFVDISVPVRGPGGDDRGILGVHLSWSWAAQIKRELIDDMLNRHQAEAFVLSADNTVLLGPPALQGQKLNMARRGDLTVQSRTHGSGRYPGLGWKVVLRQPEDVAMASFQALQIRTHIAVLALCVLLAPLFWLLARRLAAPLWELTERLEADQTSSVPLKHNPLYREADILARALARYARRQEEDAAQLKELNASLEQRVTARTAALERLNGDLSQAVNDLERSQERTRAILRHAPDAYIAIDERGYITEWNRQAERTFGWSRDEALGQDVADLIIPPPQRDAHRAGMARFTVSGTGPVVGNRLELIALHRDGHEIPVELSVAAMTTENGYIAHAFLHDISKRKQAQRLLADSERRLRDITNNLPVLIAYIDKEERYQFCNGTYRSWLGMETKNVVGQPVRAVLDAAHYEPRKALLRKALAGERIEFDIESAFDGVERHLRTLYLPDVSAGGAVEGIYVLATDVSVMKLAERQLAQLARTDSLTGLPNRHSFNEKLHEALARSRRNKRPIALLFLDIDKFKSINDSLGHAAGDEVLKVFAQRLSASVRETDTVARLAGDEFVVILEGLHAPEDLQTIAGKIIAAINQPCVLQDTELTIGTSIGIAFQGDGHASPEQLLATADKALYEAKAGGRNTFRLALA